jgi:hypothetical protein
MTGMIAVVRIDGWLLRQAWFVLGTNCGLGGSAPAAQSGWGITRPIGYNQFQLTESSAEETLR